VNSPFVSSPHHIESIVVASMGEDLGSTAIL
jgi:hypothetical protein